ncbi:MAG TPA: DEAD/DEAH box helicase family protein [Cerasibacillus sp.]|uniref:DEAD/DEAH box helicase n=1 Tax=Cerasibacillus sp. TaxID=2498711 RepID=UPI002F428BE8
MNEKLSLNPKVIKQIAGKRLLRKELPLDEQTYRSLIQMNILQPIQSIVKKAFHYECQRCHNTKRSLFGMYPCALCNRMHRYCRKCIAMGRVSDCERLYEWHGPEPIWSIHEQPCTWDGELTLEQKKAAERIVTAIQFKEKEILSYAVCGSGKTEMLFPGMSYALQQGMRLCIATPRTDVVRELTPRLRQAFQSVSIQALYGGSQDKSGTAQLIISTTHQLFRYSDAFDVVMVDEVDAFPYHKDMSLPIATKRALKPSGTMVYLTATPRDEQKKKIERQQLPHIFVARRYHNHPLPVPKLKFAFSLQKNLVNNQFPKSFLRWYSTRKHDTRQVLVFVPTIQLAKSLEQTFNTIYPEIKSSAVHSEDSNREEKVYLYRQKKIDILFTTTILERGVTFPAIDVAILHAGHHVFDEAALVQIAGRAGRSPDDPDGEVVFFHDGKTEAMVQAIYAIEAMNKRGGFT